jgi:hypothetical protein
VKALVQSDFFLLDKKQDGIQGEAFVGRNLRRRGIFYRSYDIELMDLGYCFFR